MSHSSSCFRRLADCVLVRVVILLVFSFFHAELGLAQPLTDSDTSVASRNDAESREVEIDLNGDAPPASLGPAQQLLLEQIEELIASEEFEEAVGDLENLIEAEVDLLVPRGRQQRAATIVTQCYEPTREWATRRLAQLFSARPALRVSFQKQRRERVEIGYQEMLGKKDLKSALELAQRNVATHRADDFRVQAIDLLLERGWSIAACQELERLCPELRVEIQDGSNGSLPWSVVFPKLKPKEVEAFSGWLQQKIVTPNRQSRLVAALQRIVLAGQLDSNSVALRDWQNWAAAVVDCLEIHSRDPATARVLEGMKQTTARLEDDSTVATFAGSYDRAGRYKGQYRVDAWPLWSQSAPIYMATTEQTPASKPRVGESSKGTLPYHPLVFDGKVFVNTLTDIRAYDLESGEPWPDTRLGTPLFDSHLSPSAYMPLGYPLLGTPRGTLSIDDGQLFARMGEPVTGWANRRRALDGGSVSYIVGLDLKRQGSMLPGFPLHLSTANFNNAEFDGPPILFGDLLIAPVVERDNVGLRRLVVAYYRDTGAFAWKSQVLASGLPAGGERANLISHQLLSAAGGRLFYNTNLGSIACLDPTNGKLVWLTQYRQAEQSSDFPRPDRFRYRDLTPCLLHKGLLYCAPQDCPELFALDVSQGGLVWSTDGEQVADAIHLLGVSEEHLVVSGDRLTWLDRRTGRVAARYPGGSTTAILNALPDPRGLGRGVISEDEVYWPVSGELLVFRLGLDASAGQRGPSLDVSPTLLRRVALGARAREGGNLVATSTVLLYASPTRIMVFD
ncbi:MAG: PQQ-binding-like beta-propeller repeat protein [Planctomycetota bacterium]|nr:PQQ-binding-like beta-propeller repeat protein [Planctomycetota bacterium]